jgi:hypothetical protein
LHLALRSKQIRIGHGVCNGDRHHNAASKFFDQKFLRLEIHHRGVNLIPTNATREYAVPEHAILPMTLLQFQPRYRDPAARIAPGSCINGPPHNCEGAGNAGRVSAPAALCAK